MSIAARQREQGVALITVLLVVAIATVVTAGMIARQQLSIRSSSNQLEARQVWHYALGGEALAQAILTRDLKQAGSNPGHHARQPSGNPVRRRSRRLHREEERRRSAGADALDAARRSRRLDARGNGRRPRGVPAARGRA